jgi:hypothetical protein
MPPLFLFDGAKFACLIASAAFDALFGVYYIGWPFSAGSSIIRHRYCGYRANPYTHATANTLIPINRIPQKVFADAGRTSFFNNMSNIFISEKAYS